MGRRERSTIDRAGGLAVSNAGQVLVFEPAALPFVDSHKAVVGTAVSEASYSLNDSEFMIYIVEHARPRKASVISREVIYFTIDADATYSISNECSMLGFDIAAFESILFNLSTGLSLFDNEQQSRVTTDESFEFGQECGDLLNRLSGSLEGDLHAGDI